VFAYEQRGEVVPIITDEDDGTLAKNEQTITPGVNRRTVRALGANHVSAQNHSSVRTALDDIFTNNIEFLVTKPR
jgi:hypothetical protein